MQDRVPHVDAGLSLERPDPGQHLVQQHAGGKNVRARIHFVAARLFRRRVGRSSVRHADFRQFGLMDSRDGGLLFALALTAFVGSAVVLVLRRSQIPVFGRLFHQLA